MEVVVLDDESVRLGDLEARQRDVREPVPEQHQLLHFVCLYLKYKEKCSLNHIFINT